MGVSNLPVTTGTDIQDFDWLIQLWWMYRERVRSVSTDCIAFNRWPEMTSFTVSSIVDNGDGTGTITAPTGTDWSHLPATCGGKLWHGRTCSNIEICTPSDYDVILEPDDTAPEQTIRCYIQDNGTDTLSIDFKPIENAITAKWIASLSDLSSCKAYIIKHGTASGGQPWWTESIPQHPNDHQQWIGTADQGHLFLDGTGYVRQFNELWKHNPYFEPSLPAVAWAPNHFAGKECLVFDIDRVLHRLTISSNDINTLYFGSVHSSSSSSDSSDSNDSQSSKSSSSSSSSQSIILGSTSSQSSQSSQSSSSSSGHGITLSGPFIILLSGGKGAPGRRTADIYCWNKSAGLGLYTHLPDDTIGTTQVPNHNVGWEEGDPAVTCSEEPHDCKDTPCQIPFGNCCEPGRNGDVLAPFLQSTLRWLQGSAIGLGPQFVDPDFAGGDSAKPLVTAFAFDKAGVNAWTSSFSVSSGTATISVDIAPPRYPYSVYIAVWDDVLRDWVVDGTATITNSGGVLSGTYDNALNGKTAYISYGYSRFTKRAYQYAYPKTCCIADCREEGGCIDPFNDDDYSSDGCDYGPGKWVKKGVSDKYIGYDDDGIAELTDSFVVGEYATFAGDQVQDPATALLANTNSPLPIDFSYYDHFYRGRNRLELWKERNSSRSGVCTSGTKYSFTDLAQDWWDDGINTGTMRVECGTATGGSTTSLTFTSPTFDAACWWEPGRFLGFDSPYQGFVLEVYKGGIPSWCTCTRGTATGSPPEETGSSSSSSGSEETPTMFKVVITSAVNSGGTVTVNFAAADGLTVAAGDFFLIREPRFELSKWEARALLLTEPDGTTHLIESIIANDNDTVFFPPLPTEVGFGWTYEILEYLPGGVWEYATTAPTDDRAFIKLATNKYWVQPKGADATRLGVPTPADFHINQYENAATVIKEYGLMRVGDYVEGTFINEIYHVLQLLNLTKIGYGWYHGPDYDSGGTALNDPDAPNCPGTNVSFWDGGEWHSDIGEFGCGWGGTADDGVHDDDLDFCTVTPSVYHSYGWDLSGAVGGFESHPPFDCDFVDGTPPSWTEGITAAFVYGRGVGDDRVFCQGIWDGPTAIFAYGKGNFSGNCYAPDGNGVEVKLYQIAKKPNPGASTAQHLVYSDFDSHGQAVAETYLLYDTVTTGYFDPSWETGDGPSPVNGTFFSATKLGDVDTDTVSLTCASSGSTFSRPPLPTRVPQPDCSYAYTKADPAGPDSIDNWAIASCTVASGFTVSDWFGIIDWSSYYTYT